MTEDFQPRPAKAVYIDMRDNMRRMKHTVAKLMRHPDSTPEQIWEVHQQYMKVWQSFVDVTYRLREKYPDRYHSVLTAPWHSINLKEE
jgi:hypothetical protein